MDGDEPGGLSQTGVAQGDPVPHRNCLRIAHVQDVLRRGGQNDPLHEAAQVPDVEELQLQLPLPGEVERPVRLGTVKDEGLPVDVVHGAVQVGRPQDVSIGDPGEKSPFGGDLPRAVGTPEAVGAQRGILLEGLGAGVGIDGAGADHNVLPEGAQGIQKGCDIRRIIGGDVGHHVEGEPLQLVPQFMAIPLYEADPLLLGLCVPVEDIDLIAPLQKIARGVPLTKVVPPVTRIFFMFPRPFCPKALFQDFPVDVDPAAVGAHGVKGGAAALAVVQVPAVLQGVDHGVDGVPKLMTQGRAQVLHHKLVPGLVIAAPAAAPGDGQQYFFHGHT